MDHKDFVGAVAASMGNANVNSNPTPKELEEERIAELRQQPEDSEAYEIRIPLITGKTIKIDSREVNWDMFGTPENLSTLEQNEGLIRGMVHSLITADFSDPKTDEMIKDFEDGLTNLFTNFGIEDPGYEEMKKTIMVKPYVLLLGKCFDAITLINVLAHNTVMHNFATQVFGITNQFDQVANLNDITEMDNSAEGLISADRRAFEGVPEDHDVSGLLGD